MLLLGAGHKARQGKTEFCNTIIEYCDRVGISWQLFSISDLIISYAIANGILPQITREECTAEQVNILVQLGVELRKGDDDILLRQLEAAIDKSKAKVGLIPNIRQENEAHFVKSRKGWLVELQRFNANGTRFVDPTRDPNHILETTLDSWNWDFTVGAKSGQRCWLRRQAIGLFDYLRDGGEGEGRPL